VETVVDSKTDNLELAVVFPINRAFKNARALRRLGAYSYAHTLGDEGFTETILESGQKQLIWRIKNPKQGWVYTIEWVW